MESWTLGDRVTREMFMDDGTWTREGDRCLGQSPLKHGEVVEITDEASRASCLGWVRPYEASRSLFGVLWDDQDQVEYFFRHGIQREAAKPSQNPQGKSG